MELGLERVAAVARRLAVLPPGCPVLTVAGTNGKGSSVALLDAILRAGGRTVGAYTSPHLLRYNERIRRQGIPIGDPELCRAFERVEAARERTPLTVFEFGTLAALAAMDTWELDVAVLEVGLGGRLDAVNVVDADAALVTAIDLDHMEWLGPDRESIGREKAGVFRPGRPAVCADPAAPASVGAVARTRGARYLERGRDFGLERSRGRWRVRGRTLESPWLPPPSLPGEHQLDNAAGVLVLLAAAGLLPGWDAVAAGLREARLPGRLQELGKRPRRIVDVGHNPAAAAALARWLEGARPRDGVVRCVLAMLGDKDHAGFLAALRPVVDCWYPASLAGERGLDAGVLAELLGPGVRAHGDVGEAWAAALEDSGAGDLILATGSFLTAEAVLRAAAAPVAPPPPASPG